MDTPESLDEEAILRVVRTWPRDQQLDLAHRILESGLGTLDPLTGRPYAASEELLGLLKGDRPAPSDEEIERWRDEKYEG